MTTIDFIIFALATYRLTRAIIQDEILSPLRARVFHKFPPETTKTGYLFTCEWCLSIWVGLGFAGWYTINADTARFFAVALALSAIAGLLTAHENRD